VSREGMERGSLKLAPLECCMAYWIERGGFFVHCSILTIPANR
jgi:hypothetical protein